MGALISYRNDGDTAGEVSGPELENFPVSNLLTRQLSATWRTNRELKGGTPEIFVDLGEVKPVRVVALLATNRERPNSYGDDLVIFMSEDNVDWMPLAIGTAANDAAVPGLPRNIVALTLGTDDAAWPMRYLRIIPQWETVNSEPYFEAGRLWIGDGLYLPEGVDGEWELGVHDRGRVQESAGLQVYVERRKQQRVLSLPISNLDTTQAFGFADADPAAANVPSMQDMFAHVGATGEIIAIPRAESPLWIRRTGVYGRLTD
ncbi:MAG: hypothetical protein RL684_2478, partial [Pseudomonadota bacterium]